MEIIWTDFAIKNLKEIFEYYANIAHKKVAHKIKNQILSATNQLKENPNSGQIELNLVNLQQNYRYLVSGNYKVIYKTFQNQIIIYDVFDTRQNPIKMLDKDRFRKK